MRKAATNMIKSADVKKQTPRDFKKSLNVSLINKNAGAIPGRAGKINSKAFWEKAYFSLYSINKRQKNTK